MWRNQRKVLIDFVLPASVQREPVEVSLPHTYVLLCSALVHLESKEKDGERSFEVPPLTARIEYMDIGNRKHQVTFDFQVDLISIAGAGEAFNGYVDCRIRS